MSTTGITTTSPKPTASSQRTSASGGDTSGAEFTASPGGHAERLNRRGLTKAGVLGGIATTAGIALTATSGWLIVRAAEQPVILTLLTAIVAVRTFGMVRPVFRYWERLASHDAALATLAGRRTAAYAGLIPLTPARLGRRRRSDVLTGVVEDLTDVVDAQVRVTVPVISTVIASTVTIGLIAWIEPAVGVVVAAVAVAVAIICAIAFRLESGSLTELLDARAEVGRVSELLTGQADDLRAVGGWATAMGWLDEAHRALARATRRQSLGRAAASGLFLLTVGAAVVVTAHLVAPLAIGGPVKALLLLTPVAVADAISPLSDAMQSLARARGSESRISTLLGLEPAVHDRGVTHHVVPDGVPALEARGLTASWTGDHDDVGPIDLDLPPGSKVALLGPNGSGKSTLLAALARHLDVRSGSVRWDGLDARDVALEEIRAQIAFVDDEPHLFATSLRHNLSLAAPDASDDDLARALERAGLGAFLSSLPEGLDTMIGAGGRGMSGGERARLAVARALASGRPIILLDEPVAHLDSPTARAVLSDLLRADTPDPPDTPHPVDTPDPAAASSDVGPSHTDPAPDPTDAGLARTIVIATHRVEGLEHVDRVITLGPVDPVDPVDR